MNNNTQISMPIELVTPELLAKHDMPGPRYTSYPTAMEFSDDFIESDYVKRLSSVDARAGEPLSLYVHIPFCERRCSFCGCNVIISKRREIADKYLEYLFKEIELLAAHLPNRRKLVQYHWGGGTPTYLNLKQITALQTKVSEYFDLDKGAESAIEVDPDVTTVEQLVLLKKMGFNRLSIGVQDFDTQVLAAVNRAPAEKKVNLLISKARSLGFESVNIDLIYGLPLQTPKSFAFTLDKIVKMRPDRIAVYSFAYVPWIKGNQKKLPANYVPNRDIKLALFANAVQKFINAGYLQIGMDHFALPDDHLGKAASNKTLFRNFMGYTVHRSSDMVGIGVSSIGVIDAAFAQNFKQIKPYYAALDNGIFPIERGRVLSKDDLIRQRVISEIMCNFYVNAKEISHLFNINFHDYFAHEIKKLQVSGGQVEQGFVFVGQDGLEVLPLGRLFVRNVCMVFDAYLKNKSGDKQVFSRTV